jgi:hypothetical protein
VFSRGGADTSEAPARAYVAPGPAPNLTAVDRLILAALESMTARNQSLNQFSGNCAVDPEVSADKITLSLDGHRLTRQSVGQHVCTD